MLFRSQQDTTGTVVLVPYVPAARCRAMVVLVIILLWNNIITNSAQNNNSLEARQLAGLGAEHQV